MKIFKAISLALFTMILFFSCSTDNEPLDLMLEEETEMRKPMESKMVTIPFKANFSVWDQSDYTDPSCGEGWFNLTMVGEGTINHLGKMSTIMKFCLNPSNGYYENVDGVFVAANGDELYFEVPEGWVLPIDGGEFLYYQSQFDDPINFLGGTGRFEGASGNATTNAYVHSIPADEWRTDFFSEGSLTIKPGSRSK